MGALAVTALLATAALAVDPPYRAAPATGTFDVAVVLSGDVDDLRIRHAAALWRDGRVPRLLTTGRGVGQDDAHVLRQTAIALGVPAEAVLVEDRSTTTRENLLFARDVLRRHGLRRALLVTSRSHMARALRTARRAAPDIEWCDAPVPDAGPLSRRVHNRAREWVRLAAYAARGWI